MLNISRTEERNDLARLSDAELVAQMADIAKQLGVDIKIDYSFIAKPVVTETDGSE